MPPRLPLAQSSTSLAPGTICLYEHDGRPLLGIVRSYKNKKYQLLNQRGREVELPDFRLHALGIKLAADKVRQDEQAQFLDQTYERCFTASAEVNLELVWSAVCSEERYYNSSELADLYYQSPTPEQHLTLRLALLGDRIFFKRQEDGFSPRPEATVQELKVSEQSRKDKLRIQQLALANFSARIKDPATALAPELEAI
ncbi:MAG: hypothetical protein K1X79_11745, partial [Oligoflexia bacterium]|nr:hypothetical protein [Oligoflexia bacterium]